MIEKKNLINKETNGGKNIELSREELFYIQINLQNMLTHEGARHTIGFGKKYF